MHKAFRKFDTTKPYRPKLTIVVCGKRHHTRFYPTQAENADKDGNPKPGTVVDRGVTAIYDFDFFLQGMSFVDLHNSCFHHTILQRTVVCRGPRNPLTTTSSTMRLALKQTSCKHLRTT